MKFSFPTIYPITDTAISGLSIPEQVRRLIKGGASLIQIREKRASSREFYEAAAASVEIAREDGIRIIVNDRVDIAMLVEADGVHLGQNDLSPIHARELLGKDAIIGYSTHTLEQAEAAIKMPIDYLAFGPVFATSTKDDPDPVVGLEILAQIKEVAGNLPLVAIGGITPDNIHEVLKSRADSAAMIKALIAEPEKISANIADLLSIRAYD